MSRSARATPKSPLAAGTGHQMPHQDHFRGLALSPYFVFSRRPSPLPAPYYIFGYAFTRPPLAKPAL
ncbi:MULTISPECIES: hypothetical protein [Bradyrhizobium]|uniref:Uncharacterized protein n=1 Tax=Bradyrhizobium retamae TaxID=1300035 RepID=A0A0R3MGY9_9BRAD|nr:hypothetical protein [Bradyrhizobium retamae]KRR19212.1 hypothetical protein CQ13_34180 [Bradyrhizobium retamae]